jgi:hypothetical protein
MPIETRQTDNHGEARQLKMEGYTVVHNKGTPKKPAKGPKYTATKVVPDEPNEAPRRGRPRKDAEE